MSTYSATQRDVDGNPFVAEAHFPELNAWSAYTTNHSEHYDHSTYLDDVITGLLGLVPRSDNMLQISPIIPDNWTYFALGNVAYHGHLVSVLYDADGTRYNVSAGLSIFVDGVKLHTSKSSSTLIRLPKTAAANNISVIPVNIAANPIGEGFFPNATATTTYPGDSVWKGIDGFVFYDFVPDNRWTNNQSWYMNDTYGITFARPRTFSSVTLAIYADREYGGLVDCPSAVEVYTDHGIVANVSDFGEHCLPNDRNTISFDKEVTSLSLSVNMFIKRGYAVGFAELEVWVPPNRGPVYYMVDGYPTGTNITFDTRSTATATGAVIGNNSVENNILLPGIYSGEGGTAALSISYKNTGRETASIAVDINRFPAGNLTLVPTGQTYEKVEMTAELWPGENYVSLSGGNTNVFLETMTVAP